MRARRRASACAGLGLGVLVAWWPRCHERVPRACRCRCCWSSLRVVLSRWWRATRRVRRHLYAIGGNREAAVLLRHSDHPARGRRVHADGLLVRRGRRHAPPRASVLSHLRRRTHDGAGRDRGRASSAAPRSARRAAAPCGARCSARWSMASLDNGMSLLEHRGVLAAPSSRARSWRWPRWPPTWPALRRARSPRPPTHRGQRACSDARSAKMPRRIAGGGGPTGVRWSDRSARSAPSLHACRRRGPRGSAQPRAVAPSSHAGPDRARVPLEIPAVGSTAKR